MRVKLVILAVFLLSGCLLQQLRPSERLREAVHRLNDETRWGRLDLATTDVGPAYREEFATRRYEWGRSIQIADQELLSVVLDDSGDHATSTLAVSWYALDTMTVRETTVKQSWAHSGGTFVLVREEVASGDETIFGAEEAPVEEEPAVDEGLVSARTN